MTATKVTTLSLLDAIHDLIPRHQNFIPMHVLREYCPLSREAFDQEIYDLQRDGEIDLHEYCGGDYTSEQLEAGIQQQLSLLFYVSVGELEII